MPRKTDPGAIRIGSGKTVPSPTTIRLNGTIPPNIGTVPGADTSGDVSSVETRHLFSDLFSSWVLEGGRVSSVDAGATIQVSWTALTILYKGQRISLPAGTTSFPDVTPYHKYVYVSATPETGTGRHPVLLTDDLPLITGDVSAHHILLGLVSNDGTGRVTTDLRDILTDVDQRENLYVGNGEGTEAFTPHFTTLADAVAYANEMQSPTSGDPGRRFHIQVVGYTDEADATLPIKIKTPGLMITGSPRMRSGTEKVEVCWSAPGKAVIDFNGQSDTIVRDVSFRCTLNETLYPPGNPQRDRGSLDRVLLVNTSTTICQRVCVENCRLSGPAQGFLGIYSGTFAGFANSRFVHNQCTDLLDVGITLATGSLPADYCQFRENSFEMDSVHPGALYTAKFLGGIYLAGNPARYVRIEDNIIRGFATGIYADGTDVTIEGNYIYHTMLEGIKIFGSGTIKGNQVVMVYNSVPVTRRQGLTASGFVGEISRNSVSLNTTGANDFQIVVGGTPCWIRDNQATRFEIDCDDSVIQGNIGTVLTILSDSCAITDCKFSTVNLTGNNNYVSGGKIVTLNAGGSSTGTLVSSGHVIEGSRLGDVYLGESSQISDCNIVTLYAASRDKIHSNVIISLRDYTAIVGTRVIEDAIIEGNAIAETVALACTKLHFKGNKLQGNITSDSSLILDSAAGSGVTPSDHIIEGNYIEGIISCGAAISGAARSRFVNNQIGDRGADTNHFNGDDILISGNTFLSDSSVIGNRIRVDANNATRRFFSLSGTGTTKFITNNYAASMTVSEGGVISGNILSGNLTFFTDATGCIIIGNIIGGNLGAAADESNAVTMGNRVTGTIYGAGPVAAGPKSSEVAVAGTPFNIS